MKSFFKSVAWAALITYVSFVGGCASGSLFMSPVAALLGILILWPASVLMFSAVAGVILWFKYRLSAAAMSFGVPAVFATMYIVKSHQDFLKPGFSNYVGMLYSLPGCISIVIACIFTGLLIYWQPKKQGNISTLSNVQKKRIIKISLVCVLVPICLMIFGIVLHDKIETYYANDEDIINSFAYETPQKLKRIIKKIDVNMKTQYGETPLLSAIQRRDVSDASEVIKSLIKAGADVNAKDEKRKTPLMAAAVDGTVETVKILIEAGADVNAKDIYGNTPLILAYHRLDIISILIKAGADVNAGNKSGITPLMDAASLGNPEIVTALIKYGADVNAKDNYGNTPLMSAYHRHEVIPILIKAGADINATNKGGWTPLIMAAQHSRNPEVINTLIKFGADINATSKDGWTPLILAAKDNGNPEVINILIKSGMDINSADKQGTTPLIAAARSNNLGSIIILLKLGADPKIKDNEGKIAIDYVRKNPDMLRKLEEASR